jgi:hypothetical protein
MGLLTQKVFVKTFLAGFLIPAAIAVFIGIEPTLLILAGTIVVAAIQQSTAFSYQQEERMGEDPFRFCIISLFATLSGLFVGFFLFL